MGTSVISAFCIVVLVAVAPLNWSKAQTVTVIETEYRFDPNHLTLRVGMPYRLRLENRGQELHEFTAPAFLQAVELANPDVLNPERTEIATQPGQQQELYFVPTRAGRYPFICADHDWAGMTGEIVVE